ncbi:MAG: LysR substrate-binding domain-containing protein, partial [Pseudomonadales bacterium]|nr:LysR substrate-binding domain-containing protein [Pseudomonadales bacterium]
LHLTPPAVSIQVKQLAESAGEPLIDQVGKQIFLTDAGKAVAEASKDIFERIDSLQDELAGIQSLEQGSLSVSIITTAKYFVPRLLGTFASQYPDIEVALFVGNRQSVLDRLNENKDDFYVLGRPPDNLKVEAIPFAPNPLVAIAPPNHPLANSKNISAKRISEEPFIVRESGSGVRMSTLQYFRERNLSINIRMELGSNEAVKQIVMGNLGISFLAESTLTKELELGELIKLDVEGLPIERHWFMVHQSKKLLSPLANAFKEYLMRKDNYTSLKP